MKRYVYPVYSNTDIEENPILVCTKPYLLGDLSYFKSKKAKSYFEQNGWLQKAPVGRKMLVYVPVGTKIQKNEEYSTPIMSMYKILDAGFSVRILEQDSLFKYSFEPI